MAESDPRLLNILGKVLGSRGYVAYEAVYQSSKDFSFSWGVKGKNVTIKVPDYLDQAPDEALEDFLRGAASYMFGGKHVFGKEYMKYTTSDEFINLKRPVFFKRTRAVARSDVGTYRNLFDSVQRLLDSGLLNESDIGNTQFSWTTKPTMTRLGYCMQMFRIVVISRVFDDPNVPERLLDYVVYHECMHLRQGYRPFNRSPHDAEFRKQMSVYPDGAEIDRELKKLREYVSRRDRRYGRMSPPIRSNHFDFSHVSIFGPIGFEPDTVSYHF